jgi:hypothetical protein
MKRIAVVVASLVNLAVFGNAFAHGDHPSSHGGIMGRGDDAVVVEFVMEKGTLVVYVHDENGKPLPKKDVTATLSLLAPHSLPQEVKLVRAGEDKFTAPTLKPATGDRLRAHIKLPTGEEFESMGLYAK